MKSEKVKIPTGHIIDRIDHESGEVTFKPKPQGICERIKTIDDVVNALDPDDADVQAYSELLSKFGEKSHIISYQFLVLLAKALNEGWVPNWDNNKYEKYYPWFWMNGGSSGFRYDVCDYRCSASDVGSRLCFKSNELAEYAGKQFIDVYKQYMTI